MSRKLVLSLTGPLALILLLASFISTADERHIVVLPLNYAIPETLVPILKPVLSNESSITAFRNRLILNATNTEVSTVQELLIQLDSRPRQLLITVSAPNLQQALNNAQKSGALLAMAGLRLVIISRDE